MSLDIAALQRDVQKTRDLLEHATPGPWAVLHIEDDYFMNCFAVVADERLPDASEPEYLRDLDNESVVCLTLLQAPRHMAAIYDGNWDTNANFIAAMRSLAPTLADQLDDCIQEIQSLRAAL